MANFDVNNKLSLPELSFYNWHNQVIRQIMGNTSSMVDAMRVYQRELYNRFGLSLELSTPDGHIKITVNGRDTYFPDTPRNLPLFLLFSVIGYQRWMQAKYTSEGVDVDSNDIVISKKITPQPFNSST